jgi:cell division protein ZapA
VAEVDVRIGGRKYELSCRAGDEDRLRMLAEMVDGKANEILRSMGGVSEARQLLFTALLLADDLSEELARNAATTASVASATSAQPAPPAADDEVAAMVVEELANRVEALAARLENGLAKS